MSLALNDSPSSNRMFSSQNVTTNYTLPKTLSTYLDPVKLQIHRLEELKLSLRKDTENLYNEQSETFPIKDTTVRVDSIRARSSGQPNASQSSDEGKPQNIQSSIEKKENSRQDLLRQNSNLIDSSMEVVKSSKAGRAASSRRNIMKDSHCQCDATEMERNNLLDESYGPNLATSYPSSKYGKRTRENFVQTDIQSQRQNYINNADMQGNRSNLNHFPFIQQIQQPNQYRNASQYHQSTYLTHPLMNATQPIYFPWQNAVEPHQMDVAPYIDQQTLLYDAENRRLLQQLSWLQNQVDSKPILVPRFVDTEAILNQTQVDTRPMLAHGDTEVKLLDAFSPQSMHQLSVSQDLGNGIAAYRPHGSELSPIRRNRGTSRNNSVDSEIETSIQVRKFKDSTSSKLICSSDNLQHDSTKLTATERRHLIQLKNLEFEVSKAKRREELEMIMLSMEQQKERQILEFQHEKWLTTQQQRLEMLQVKQILLKEQFNFDQHVRRLRDEMIVNTNDTNTSSSMITTMKSELSAVSYNRETWIRAGIGASPGTLIPSNPPAGPFHVLIDGLAIVNSAVNAPIGNFRLACAAYNAANESLTNLTACDWQPWKQLDARSDEWKLFVLKKPFRKTVSNISQAFEGPYLDINDLNLNSVKLVVEVQSSSQLKPSARDLTSIGWGICGCVSLISRQIEGLARTRVLNTGMWRVPIRKGLTDSSVSVHLNDDDDGSSTDFGFILLRIVSDEKLPVADQWHWTSLFPDKDVDGGVLMDSYAAMGALNEIDVLSLSQSTTEHSPLRRLSTRQTSKISLTMSQGKSSPLPDQSSRGGRLPDVNVDAVSVLPRKSFNASSNELEIRNLSQPSSLPEDPRQEGKNDKLFPSVAKQVLNIHRYRRRHSLLPSISETSSSPKGETDEYSSRNSFRNPPFSKNSSLLQSDSLRTLSSLKSKTSLSMGLSQSQIPISSRLSQKSLSLDEDVAVYREEDLDPIENLSTEQIDDKPSERRNQ